MSTNPYEAPKTLEPSAAVLSDHEQLRSDHIKHEASVKSIGTLYGLAAIFFLLGGIVNLVSLDPDNPLSIAMGIPFVGLGVVLFGIAFGIRKLKRSARIGVGILSGIGLLGFPIGTLINAYFLYLVFGKKGAVVFSDEYKEAIAATPQIKYRTSIVVWIVLGLFVLVVASLMIPLFFKFGTP